MTDAADVTEKAKALVENGQAAAAQLVSAEYFGNTLIEWGTAGAIAVVTFLVLRTVKAVLLNRLKKFSLKRTVIGETLDYPVAALEKTKFLVLAVFSLYAGSLGLSLSEKAEGIAHNVMVVVLMVQIGLWVLAFFDEWLHDYIERCRKDNPAAVTSVNAAGFITKLVLWFAVFLLTLDNVGIDITAMLAGMGIGGIAIALAVQSILGDLFSSLTIVLDKPFVVGDFLIVGDYMGAVESVGLKTTRIRSLSGEQLVLSNSDLLSSRIRNYGRMYERRVVFAIGVTYDTPREKLKAIPQIIRKALEAQDNTRFDRSHFKAYGAFSLDFETVYYVTKADYNVYMDIQQAVNLHIHERFEEEGIEFAFPTQTVYVANAAS